ncbi:MAG: glycerol-3-phosphate responsive antiterminator, partial [Thermotoga sp.]
TVEILPGLVAPKIALKLPRRNMTIIAAGLIETVEEAKNLLKHVDAISTSSKTIWDSIT